MRSGVRLFSEIFLTISRKGHASAKGLRNDCRNLPYIKRKGYGVLRNGHASAELRAKVATVASIYNKECAPGSRGAGYARRRTACHAVANRIFVTRGGLLRGGVEEFARVGEGGRRDLRAREHGGQLIDALVGREARERREGFAVALVFGHAKVVGTEGGDLR